MDVRHKHIIFFVLAIIVTASFFFYYSWVKNNATKNFQSNVEVKSEPTISVPPSPSSSPTNTILPSPKPTNKPNLTPTTNPTPIEGYTESDAWPIIRVFSDNLGSQIKRSDYNGYNGPYSSNNTGKNLKVGDSITWTTNATDPKGRRLLMNINSNSQKLNDVFGRGEYKNISPFTYTISQEDLQSAGEAFRVVVQIRSEKDFYRFGGGQYDDVTFLDYKLTTN